jgi:putative ABC transport system permease protein
VLVYTLDAVLLVITAATLVAIALLSVRERIRDYGVLKAMGLTPRQIASSVVGAHAAVALVAAVLSIPVGIGPLRRGVRNRGRERRGARDRPVVVALVPIGTVLMVVAATSLPARLATRIPTAEALRYG